MQASSRGGSCADLWPVLFGGSLVVKLSLGSWSCHEGVSGGLLLCRSGFGAIWPFLDSISRWEAKRVFLGATVVG